MEISEREMQSMAKAELAEMTIFSLCANTRFSKLICPPERIKARYRFYYVTSAQKDVEKAKRDILGKTKNLKDFQAFVFALSVLGGKPGVDESILSLASDAITVIDATAVRPEQSVMERFARSMACYNLADTANEPDAERFRDEAYEELRPWTEKLLASPVTVYGGASPEGVRYEALSLFYERVLEEIAVAYPYSPDTMNLDDFFFQTIGARYYVRSGYYGKILRPWEVSDPARTPERLFSSVWGDDSAWYDPRYAEEKVVILKKAFDAYLNKRLKDGEKVSFGEIFAFLYQPPYGLLPNVIGAILFGMLFRTWRDRGLIWGNGFQQDVLDDAHLLTMIENGIHNQRTWHRNALADTIMLPDQGTKAFMDAAAEIFGLDREAIRFLPELRSALRFAMEDLPRPIEAVRYMKTGDLERETLELLIQFVRLTSDEGNKTEGELTGDLDAAFREDADLKSKLKNCLYGNALREGFDAMLEKNGMNPGSVSGETLVRMCCGRQEWKWVWKEETIISRLRAIIK